MSKLTVNTGSSANFGDGTPLRTAFQYINSNFNELYANALISNNVTVGNASVNATMNSTSFSGTSNNSIYLNNVAANLYVNTSGSYTLGGLLTLNSNLTVNAALIVNSEIFATNGLYTTSMFGGGVSYIDGIVLDYVTGMGRISVGTADGLTIYNGGVGSGALMYVSNTGVVNAASFTVGTTFVANQTTLIANGATVNSTGIYAAGLVNAVSINATTSNAGTSYSQNSYNIGSSFIANTTGVYSTGMISGANLNISGSGVITGNLSISGNLTISGNSVVIGANNLTVADSVISLHTEANLAPWTTNDGQNIGVSFHYYNGADSQALLDLDNSTGRLMWWANSTDAILGNPSGTALGTFQANTLWVGTNTVYTTVNSTAFSGTANNTLYVGTVSAVNVVSNGQLSANLANYPNTTNLSANLVLYATLVGLSSNVATLTSNNSTNFNGQPASYYANATNITSGTLPDARLSLSVVNTSGSFTLSGIHTYSSNLVLQSGLTANGAAGAPGQVLTANATGGVYWLSIGSLTTNVAAQFAWTNTQSFSNTITFSGNLVFGGTIAANGVTNTGTAGYVLTSGGSGTNVYWAAAGTNVAAQYAWTNTQSFSNTITFTGSIVANTITVSANVVNANVHNLGYASIVSNTFTAATNAAQALDTFATVAYRSSKYDITVNANGQFYETSTINIVHDGTNVYISEYGIVSSNGSPLASYTATIATGTLTITVTPVLANTTFKYVKTMVNV